MTNFLSRNHVLRQGISRNIWETRFYYYYFFFVYIGLQVRLNESTDDYMTTFARDQGLGLLKYSTGAGGRHNSKQKNELPEPSLPQYIGLPERARAQNLAVIPLH